MVERTADDLGQWESEGGAPAQAEVHAGHTQPAAAGSQALTGTVNQIDWAEQIRERVSRDFDRVANAMKSVAVKQAARERSDTEALIAILEEKRTEVMSNRQAGYFIHGWQEPGDQVRHMLVKDPRYSEIRARQASRKDATAKPKRPT
jgi:hypothetical protein